VAWAGSTPIALTDDQPELRAQAERFLGDNCRSAVVRGVLEGDAPFDRDLWRKMANLGWMGAAIPVNYGGVGLGHVEPVPFSSTVYLLAEAVMAAGTEEQKQAWLPKLAAGDVIGSMAFSEGARRVTPGNLQAAVQVGKIFGVKTPVADGDVADVALVLAKEVDGASLFLVDLTGPGVNRASAPPSTRRAVMPPSHSAARQRTGWAAPAKAGRCWTRS
jgi:acyl-CoA dehydrogenase